MKTLTLSFQDDDYKMLVESFAGHFGYQATIPDADGNLMDNRQSADQFTASKVIAYLKGVCCERQQNVAREVAVKDAAKKVDDIPIKCEVS